MPQDEREWSISQGVQDARTEEGLEVQNMRQIQYDEATRILNLGGRSGLPYEVIAANPDAVEEAVNKADFDKKDWMNTSPEFAKFAAENPYHLAVLKRNEDELSYFEREWKRPLSLSWQQTWNQVEMNEINDRRARGREHWLPDDNARLDELRKTIQEHDFGAAEGINPLISLTKLIGPMEWIVEESLDEAAMGAVAGWGLGTYMGATAGTAVAPGPGTVVGGAVFGVTGFVTGGGIGMSLGGAEAGFRMMRGEQYGRFIEAGFTHEEAARTAAITGMISAIPEAAGVGRMIRHIPVVDEFVGWGAKQIMDKVATDVLVRPTVRRATTRLAGRYGLNMGIEISTEVFQDSVATVGQNYLADKYDNPDARVDYDEWVDDMASTISHTARGMMILAAGSPGSAYIADMRRARRSKQMEQTFRAIADNINNTELRTSAPETYAKFVEQVTEAKGGVWVNANDWDTFWQGENQDPDEMATRFGMDRSKLNAARGPDHNVEIPALAFAEQLAPSELFDKILPDLKFHEDDMSPREREHFDKNKPKIMRDIEANLEKLKEAESDVEVNNIIQEVSNQLADAQYDPRTAGHLAQLYRGFGVIAQELGADPEQIFSQFFGGVRRVTPEAIERSKVLEPTIDPLLNRIRRDDFPTQRQQRGASLLDMIEEMGGIDPTDPELMARDFELGAMDLGMSKAQMNRWKSGGRLLSEVAEVAAEAGYIPTNDENILLEALDRELGGEAVYGTRDTGDPGQRRLAEDMERLATMLSQLGIDLEQLSNEEARTALEAADIFDQEMTGKELRMMIETLNRATETEAVSRGTEQADVDTLLGRAEMLMPLVYQDQDFGDIQITDTVPHEDTGEMVEITEDAQVKFERAQRRKKALKALADCLSG